MYDLVDQTPKVIIITYVVIMAACFLTYPIVNLILTAIKRRD